MGLVSRGLLLILGFLVLVIRFSESTDELQPNYTSLIWNVTYHNIGTTENNSSFMYGYYNFVNSFVDFIIPEILPEGISIFKENETVISNIHTYIWSFKRFFFFLLVFVIQICLLLFGIVKMIWLLLPCQKTNSYATRNRKSWKKCIMKKYRKWVRLSWVHSCLASLMFLLVLAHNSNQDIDQGLNQTSVKLHNSLMDIETYIDTTTEQLEILLTKNFEEYLEFFIENSERTTEDVLTNLERSISNINLFDIFDGIEDSFQLVQPVLSKIGRLSEEISSVSEEITGELKNIPCLTGGCLSAIGNVSEALMNGTVIELEKGFDTAKNLSSALTGGIIASLENPDKALGNFTSAIGGKALENVGNLTNLAGNVVDLVKSDKILPNFTSSVGGKLVEGGKALENLTENIDEKISTNLGKTKEALTDLTSTLTGGNMTGNVGAGIDKLEKIGGNIFGGIGGFGHSTSSVENPEGASKTGGDITGEIGNIGKGFLNLGSKKKDNLANTPDEIDVSKSDPAATNSKKNEMENLLGGLSSVQPSLDKLANFGKTAPTNSLSNSDGTISNNSTYESNNSTYESNKVDSIEVASNGKNDFRIALNNLTNSIKNEATNITNPVASETENLIGKVFNVEMNNTPEYVPDRKYDESLVINTPKSELDEIKYSFDDLTSALNGNSWNFGKSEPEGKTSDANNSNSRTNNPVDLVGGTEGKTNINNNEKDVINQPKTTDGGRPAFNIDLRFGDEEGTTEMPKYESRQQGILGKLGDTVQGASNKIDNFGKNLFGFRRKRELNMNLESLVGEFKKISTTINEIEKFVIVDVKNFKNMSVLLSPIVKEVGAIVRKVLKEVKEEIKLGAKPLEMIVEQARKKVSYVKQKIFAYMEINFELVQSAINIFEPLRYFMSNVIAYFLLLSFIVLIIGILTRILKENIVTKYIIRGGFTSLHVAALIMACASLAYVGVGITSQKVFCETFQGPEDNGVLELIDEVNTATLQLNINTSLRQIIQNCHEDKSLYKVAGLENVVNLEDIEEKYLKIGVIKKKLDQLLTLPLNFSKVLPFENYQKAEEVLLEAYNKIVDSPVVESIDTLKNQLGSLPGVGNILKTFTDKITAFKDNFDTLKSTEDSGKTANKSFLDQLENSVLKVEKELISLENNVVGTIHNITSKLQETIIKSLTLYVEGRLIFSIENELGRCEPLSLALNNSVDEICRGITSPVNGQWFSWFVCVTISIIILVYSSIVENVYRRDPKNIQSKIYHVEENEMDVLPTSAEINGNRI